MHVYFLEFKFIQNQVLLKKGTFDFINPFHELMYHRNSISKKIDSIMFFEGLQKQYQSVSIFFITLIFKTLFDSMLNGP